MMKKKLNRQLFGLAGLCIAPILLSAQQTEDKKLSVGELFLLVKDNHPTLTVSRSDIAIARQNVEVAKNQMLPQISTGVQAYYLGDAAVIDKDFSNSTRVDMPHFGNAFSLEVQQLIWKGNVVRNGIKVQSLREELAELNYQANEQNIKLLALGYYLDLYKLHNQEAVYRKNIELAEQRLENSRKFFDQGMVTRNDVIRGELQISNLNLALQVVTNNRQILNKQLTVALGLNEDIRIVPDETLPEQTRQVFAKDYYETAAGSHPSVLMTQKAIELYDLSGKITKAERAPALAAFAGHSLQRPITSRAPVVDMYTYGWSAGLGLSFNIDALYKTPGKLQLNRLEKEKAAAQATEASRMIGVAVNAAYIKYNEAVTQNNTLQVNRDLAVENYRIMESKYNNQLAILLDLIDASNSRLDAELQFANSEINIIYSYYKLLRESGSL